MTSFFDFIQLRWLIKSHWEISFTEPPNKALKCHWIWPWADLIQDLGDFLRPSHLPAIYRWENWGTENTIGLSKVTVSEKPELVVFSPFPITCSWPCQMPELAHWVTTAPSNEISQCLTPSICPVSVRSWKDTWTLLQDLEIFGKGGFQWNKMVTSLGLMIRVSSVLFPHL